MIVIGNIWATDHLGTEHPITALPQRPQESLELATAVARHVASLVIASVRGVRFKYCDDASQEPLKLREHVADAASQPLEIYTREPCACSGSGIALGHSKAGVTLSLCRCIRAQLELAQQGTLELQGLARWKDGEGYEVSDNYSDGHPIDPSCTHQRIQFTFGKVVQLRKLTLTGAPSHRIASVEHMGRKLLTNGALVRRFTSTAMMHQSDVLAVVLESWKP